MAIAAMIALAVAMSAFAWWYRVAQTDQALAFWGAEAAWLVRRAPQVELDLVRPVEAGGEQLATVELAGRTYAVVQTRDISRAPGFLHARTALVEDASFRWDAAGSAPPEFEYLMRFRDGSRQVAVAFDLKNERIAVVSGGEVSIAPIIRGMSKFLTRQFDESAPPPSTTTPTP